MSMLPVVRHEITNPGIGRMFSNEEQRMLEAC